MGTRLRLGLGAVPMFLGIGPILEWLELAARVFRKFIGRNFSGIRVVCGSAYVLTG